MVWKLPHHRWKLPGNYRHVIRILVFYLFFWRSMRILVTAVFLSHIIYIYPFIDDISKGEPSGNFFSKLSWHIYIHIKTSIKWYIAVIYFCGAVCYPLIFISSG